MLRLNAGFSRKVGEANYGSRGASVNVELEVESNLVNDTDALVCRIRNLFDLARKSVDDELNGSGNGQTNGSQGHRSNGHRNERGATASQLKAIEAICRDRQLDAYQQIQNRFGISDLDQLTLRQASGLIDDLKSNGASNSTGGGRR